MAALVGLHEPWTLFATALIVAALGLSSTGCGATVTDQPGSGANDGGLTDVGAGTIDESDSDNDGGWTACSTPEGYSICGGASSCHGIDGGCVGYCDLMIADGGIGLCFLSAGNNIEWMQPCDVCADGDVCAASGKSDELLCAPFNAARVYEENDASSWIRYSDKGLWTGDPLPLPSECPSIPGVPTCGGNCGGCSPGEKCVGRSPLHPYGLCVAESLGTNSSNGCSVGAVPHACPGGLGCFTFVVQAEAQPLADIYSFCMPNDQCLAAAKGLPGGGKCQTF